MFHKIKSAEAIEDCQLIVHFENNQCRCYNIKTIANRFPAFQVLCSEEKLFGQVKVDSGGYGVSWNDDLDLGCNEIWENGTEIKDV